MTCVLRVVSLVFFTDLVYDATLAFGYSGLWLLCIRVCDVSGFGGFVGFLLF